jgi:hypothetical protein
MAENQVLLALADRCEREGPSIDLDADIWWALFPDAEPTKWPAYTSSLDAAVTLVPEGAYLAGVRQINQTLFWAIIGFEADAETEWQGEAKTEPMARCAASLRARAAQPEGE